MASTRKTKAERRAERVASIERFATRMSEAPEPKPAPAPKPFFDLPAETLRRWAIIESL